MRKSWIKYILAFLMVLIIRLIPFRAPNLEPIMAFQMPLGKKYGVLMSFIFGSLSIAIYDAITSGWGIWTLVTALSYGFIGMGAYFYFKKHSGRKSYAIYAIMSTILYDAITGLTIGPLFFHQSFMVSLVGQIPFTLLHLLGNVSFAIVLSPVIERWLVKKEENIAVSKNVSFVS
jgi:energy-coupling factor transport system substrate-specific component